MSRTGSASFSCANGVYVVSATSAPPAIAVRDRGPGLFGDRLDQATHAPMLAERDGKADVGLAADPDDVVGIEARVGPDDEVAARSGSAHPADRLSQKAPGAAHGVRVAASEAGVEDVSCAGGNREQGMVAADLGVREPRRPL